MTLLPSTSSTSDLYQRDTAHRDTAQRDTAQRAPGLLDARHHQGSHGESSHQRLNRKYAELLQEVRVAQTGTQLLLAFLLTLAFTPRFNLLNDFQRTVYVTSLVIGAGATALLIAPAAFHRIVFQRDLRYSLVKATNRFAAAGLALLMAALSSSLLLILDVVLGSPWSLWITTAITTWFVLWWYGLPVWNRLRHHQKVAAL
jgi:Family of unknown function (DUF6328)